eukprot:tig00000786_g4059.t1
MAARPRGHRRSPAAGLGLALLLAALALARSAAAEGRRDLVIGCNILVPPAYVYRFLRSIRSVAPDVEVAIVSPQTHVPGEETLAIYRDWNAQPILYDDTQLRASLPPRNPEIHRYAVYRQYLEQNAGRLRRVFISDLDVVFQLDPFPFIRSELEVFLDEQTHRDDYHNQLWQTECLGRAAADAALDRRIACAGTTMGTVAGVLGYARAMEAHLALLRCNHVGMDQAVHNYLVWGGSLQGVQALDNASGHLATLHSVKTLRADRYGRLLNGLGRPYAVVHQYNRHEGLVRRLEGLYPYNVTAEGVPFEAKSSR